MSEIIEKKDLIIKTNSVIKKNISKIKNKLVLIKENCLLDEEENYDNIYSKINIYFTSILNKIRVKYIEALDKYRQKIKQYEKDIIELIMEKIVLNIENNFLKENIKLLKKNEKDDNIDFFNNIKGKQKYQSQENINQFNYNSNNYLIKNNNQTPNKSRNRINDIYTKEKSFNLNKKNKYYNTYINELEKNIKKHRNAQSLLNIRKIRKEMDLIINKNGKVNNKIYNYDNFNIINEQITQNFFLKENSHTKCIKNDNNISKNFINNTSINIFNTSHSLKKLKTKNDKNTNNKRINTNILSLKSIYNNILNKKKVYNNTRLIKNKNKIKNNISSKQIENNYYNNKNYLSNIGKRSNSISKTEYNENKSQYKTKEDKNAGSIPKNKSLNQIKTIKRYK